MKLVMEEEQIEKSVCPKPNSVALWHLDDVLMEPIQTNRKRVANEAEGKCRKCSAIEAKRRWCIKKDKAVSYMHTAEWLSKESTESHLWIL